MKRPSHCLSLASVTLICGLFLALTPLALAQGQGQGRGNGEQPPGLERVLEVQDKHTPRLLKIDGVVGTATSQDENDDPRVTVYTARQNVKGIPGQLDGVPVKVQVTGRLIAEPPSKLGPAHHREGHGGGPPGGGGGGDDDDGGDDTTESADDPTDRFARPVPIGISTGNEEQCSAGTIGCRVTDGTNVYALSNNHVYALENEASDNSQVLQPGLYDTNCTFSSDNVIGQLSDYEPLRFGDNETNTMDAAIALCDVATLGTATPADGYGTPSSSTVEPSLGEAVKKYGCTTTQTHGTISGINATVRVGYSNGTATFVNQIIVDGDKGGFLKSGDSGSLLVTDSGANPVGLLFAGNRSGKTAIASPIQPILDRFEVSIDGE